MFDLVALRDAVARHGRVARVVVAAVDGSSPREVGAAMLVWADGQDGTIGGGALEWQATVRARALLAGGGTGGDTGTPERPVTRLDRIPLGPQLGQCCGGMVSVLTELHDAATLAALGAPALIARPVGARAPDEAPLAIRRLTARARSEGVMPAPALIHGWMVEPVVQPSHAVVLWGAGHVGRALVHVLAPLPGFRLTWIDTAASRFPDTLPPGVTRLCDGAPVRLVAQTPRNASHLVVTFSHTLDLELCHALLGHGFGWCGLIGSATKWKRFRARLLRLGHESAAIDRITCPIGEPALGKHPAAIAVGVAAQLLRMNETPRTETGHDDGRDRNASAASGAAQDLSGRSRQ